MGEGRGGGLLKVSKYHLIPLAIQFSLVEWSAWRPLCWGADPISAARRDNQFAEKAPVMCPCHLPPPLGSQTACVTSCWR